MGLPSWSQWIEQASTHAVSLANYVGDFLSAASVFINRKTYHFNIRKPITWALV
jgi:hypothetical protein